MGEESEQVDYQAQLEQVEQLLAADPGNAELQQLKGSLEEVIRLSRQVGEEARVEAQAWAPGTVCEAFFSSSWFPAVVDAATEASVAVTFLGYGNSETVDRASVRELTGARTVDPARCVPGFACRGRYAVDGQWYDAVIEAVTAHGFRIKFTEYGNLEEVPPEWIQAAPREDAKGPESRPHALGTAAAPGAQAPAPPPPQGPTAAGGSGTFSVPEHLKLLPTDTEEQKAKKRKKLKALKLASKGKEDEEARKSKQQSWQQFQKKAATKKRAKGFIGSAVSKSSMFATPDSVHGKVGVMNSGQGTTEFEVRKKYKLT